MDDVAPEYVVARRVLLDALVALDQHLGSLVLVGAQAVYHHTGSADLRVPLMTTDADLAVNTDTLAGTPEIGETLRAAGFRSGANPGHWIAGNDVAVDLMVVPHQARTEKSSARAARLDPHDRRTARIARGLEPSLVDNELVTIAALDHADPRTRDLRVAGPAALLTAKLIKIGERLDQADRQPDRLKEKDALDVFRLLQATEVADLLLGFERHRSDPHADLATEEALTILREHGSGSGALLALLAGSASQGDPTVVPAFAALAAEVLAAV